MSVAGAAPSPRVGFNPGTAALLDAMPDATALLDGAGTIVAVNRAWHMFALDNGGAPDRTGVGVSYLDVCLRAAATGCADASAVAEGLQAVLAGDTVECELEYACPSPTVGRWFVLRVTPVGGPIRGVLISHGNISRRKRAEQELQRKASEDPLTGLANRTLFIQRLTAALTSRTGRPARADVGLLYIDLDGFKPINDTHGHAAGDEVLQTVASRLSAISRAQDTVARLGGDEFVMVAPRVSAAGLAGLSARIGRTLAEPHPIHSHLVHVGASVGTYLAAPGDVPEDTLHRADAAMYTAKRGRRSGSW